MRNLKKRETVLRKKKEMEEIRERISLRKYGRRQDSELIKGSRIFKLRQILSNRDEDTRSFSSNISNEKKTANDLIPREE